jgi:hypothetical protein
MTQAAPVATWQPDWPGLESTADSLIASSPLAARIATVSPEGGHITIALQANLSDVLAHAGGPLSGPLVVAVDTLNVASGETVIDAPAVSIVARSIVVDGDEGTLLLRSDESDLEGIQVTTSSITGTLDVGFENADGTMVLDGGGALALDAAVVPQVLTGTAGGAAPTASSAQQSVADTLHEPWAVVALGLSAAIGATLVDQGTGDASALADAMLRWAVAGSSALLGQHQKFPSVDYDEVASIQTSAVGLLAFTQAQASGATYVPALSSSIYSQQIDDLLAVAAIYDSKLTDLQDTKNIDAMLASFAKTLGDTYATAETPLVNALERLAKEAGSVEEQLLNASVQLQEVSATLPGLRDALVDAIKQQFQHELVKAALDTFSTVLTLYLGAAGAILGNPEALAGNAEAEITAAIDVAQKLIEAGQGLGNAINAGAGSAALPPTPDTSAGTELGAQYLTGSLASFGTAMALLWDVVALAASEKPLNLSPDLVKAVDKIPDLSHFSVGGLDPTTYWHATVVQTQAAVKPNQDLQEATDYLAAIELAATYGSAVGDLQMKLLELYTQGMAAFDQLQATYKAEASWAALKSSLTSEGDQVAAAAGLLKRGYLNVVRSLVLSVANYRAAFLYQWLQPAPVEVDVSMDLVSLRQQASNSVTGLEEVLAGTASGAVHPRQNFGLVKLRISQDSLFKEVDGKGQAQFTIDMSILAAQLAGDTAVYLTAATFVLQGGSQPEEVELQIATSGHYRNRVGTTDFRFVSRSVSMMNNYRPDDLPKFVTPWKPADAASYLAPTPYTNWTLTVDEGDWQHATAIDITLSGVLLQNPT